MHFDFIGTKEVQAKKKEKKPEKERDKPEGNPQPATVVFGFGYILEYNTGILAVTEPREPFIEGRKTKLHASRPEWWL